MEIKDKTIEDLEKAIGELNSLLTTELHLAVLDNNSIETMSDELKNNLHDIIHRMSWFGNIDLMPNFIAEVDSNVVHIENDRQVIRYLEDLVKRLSVLEELTIPMLPNDLFNTKYSNAIFYDEINLGRVIDDEKTYYKYTDPVMGLKISHLGAYEIITDFKNYVIEQLEKFSPNVRIFYAHDLTADRHKLILLHKTGVLDFLRDKYLDAKSPLMIKEDFNRLIENLIDAKTKDIGSDVGKLISESLDPKKPKTIETRSAVNAVNAFLASLGLSV